MNQQPQPKHVSRGPWQSARYHCASHALLRSSTLLTPLLALLIGVATLPGTAHAASYNSAEAGFWSDVNPGRQARSAHHERRSSKTRQHRPAASEAAPSRMQQSETQPSRTRQSLRGPVPRGSGGYVAPVLPPSSPVSNQPVTQPYQPPHITTFSDRVNDAIQAYPLQKGIGNNPIDQQQFIRQRANGVP